MNFNDFLIIIPAFNEEETVGSVVSDLRQAGFTKIIVIDDGSRDQTAKRAYQVGAKVLRHIFNLGLGGALATGFSYARNFHPGWVITADADGQHRVVDTIKLAEVASQNKVDVIYGSRFLDHQVIAPVRRLVLYFSNWLTFFLFGVKTTDSQSGLRAFSPKAVQKIKLRSLGFEVSSEIFGQIKTHGLTYGEVPIKAIYTEYSLRKGQSLSNSFNLLFRLLSLRLNP